MECREKRECSIIHRRRATETSSPNTPLNPEEHSSLFRAGAFYGEILIMKRMADSDFTGTPTHYNTASVLLSAARGSENSAIFHRGNRRIRESSQRNASSSLIAQI
ncbi:hypothetical protein MHYP_G00070680 [Metynnis hypsauchen]